MANNLGRDSAIVVLATLFAYLLINSDPVSATTYTVGDGRGWIYNDETWPIGKKFKAGDTLVFNYDPTRHNVVAVSKKDYKKCSLSSGYKVYKSGKDSINLVKGPNYFICSFPGHCENKMKIAIVAN